VRIFHIATVADWEAARSSGRYTTSTRGRTLAEEGFIHASRGDQWQAVRERWYADVTEPLVLLVLDTALLTSPVVEEAVPGSGETFPHVYGPLDVDAVVQTIPLDGRDVAAAGAREPTASFSRLFLEELFRNVLVACGVLVAVVAGVVLGAALDDTWGPAVGGLVGLALGVLVARRLARRTTS
jgi:uncharacterized protein (DUF952 family)